MADKVPTRTAMGDAGRALLFGVAVAWSLSTLILVAKNTDVSPLPAPLGVAFAHKVFGAHLTQRGLLPVGLALHTAWVTAGIVVYVVAFRRRLTLANAALVAAGMWLIANVVFVPATGWGLFAADQGADVAAALVVTHALFAVFAWALCRTAFTDERVSNVAPAMAAAAGR